ncbi:antitoxin VapB family protein [Halorubrum rubrum]|uniref:Antitoxin VapB family protein n=1 Tax=Halorubrum rubrum TaxID=1126240 RepID=A0ABD5R085_9EURY|nr:antitoxin VapB family protein [Halorubrum rubrum]
MADKTIRVSEETWRKLRARKRGDESFEAVIERELEDDDPLAGFGAWSDTTIDESVREVKSEMDEDLEAGP